MVQYNMRCPVNIPNLTRHQTKPFIFILGIQRNIILLDNHLAICLPELNGSPSVDLRQPVNRRQVNRRLIHAVPAPTLPVSPQVVVVPVDVAPGGGHGQDPLRFDDVEAAGQLGHRTPGFRRLGSALTGTAHGLLD